MKWKFVALSLSLLTIDVGRAERLHVSDGTPIRVRLKSDLVSTSADQGSRVDFEVAQSVTFHGLVAIPEGTVAWGAVQSARKDKEVKFDIEGVRPQSLQQLKLRSIRERITRPGKTKSELRLSLPGASVVRWGRPVSRRRRYHLGRRSGTYLRHHHRR